MKSCRLTTCLALFSLTLFSTAGCAEKTKEATTLPAVKPAAVATTPDAPAPDSPDVAFARWSEIKGYTYDQRDLFLAGLKGLEARVDALITELTGQRAAMDASNTRTTDWDFAMKEMVDARTNLKSTNDDMAKVTRENWDQLKDKVGVAWVRTQDAYAKVKSSTTK